MLKKEGVLAGPFEHSVGNSVSIMMVTTKSDQLERDPFSIAS